MLICCRPWPRRVLLAIALCVAGVMPLAAADNDRALCAASADDPDEAVQACTRILAQKARGIDVSQVYNDRGAAWFKKGHFDNAIADFSDAINRNTKFAPAYRN